MLLLNKDTSGKSLKICRTPFFQNPPRIMRPGGDPNEDPMKPRPDAEECGAPVACDSPEVLMPHDLQPTTLAMWANRDKTIPKTQSSRTSARQLVAR